MAATGHRLTATRRDGRQVTTLELFFDLVFVLAITQTSGLMETGHAWRAVGQALLALGVIWWTWVGYAWLTSVVDPDSGLARLVVLTSMGGLLVMAICVPEAFGDRALLFAVAYGVVRAMHILLFWLTSADDPDLRRSVAELAGGTVVGVGLLVVAAFLDGPAQAGLWALALVLDMGVPFLFGSEGWRIVPAHFVERHGLIVILALGESIVALGVGAELELTGAVIAAAVVGLALGAAMWWSYFDVGALMAEQRLTDAPPGKVQNEMARDGYSFLHLPIVAGIVLVAVGTHGVLVHVGDHLDAVSAFALGGGLAIFMAGQFAFKWRVVGTRSPLRAASVVVFAGLAVLATVIPAWVTLAAAAVLLWALIAVEARLYAEVRAEVRQRQHAEHASPAERPDLAT